MVGKDKKNDEEIKVIFIDDLMDIFTIGDGSSPSYFDKIFKKLPENFKYELYTINKANNKSGEQKGNFVLFNNNICETEKKFEGCKSFCELVEKINFKDAYVYIDYSLNGNQLLIDKDNDSRKVIKIISEKNDNLPKSLCIYSAIRPGDAKELAIELNSKINKFNIDYTCFSNSKYFAEEYLEEEFNHLKELTENN